MTIIYIDADACPVREEALRVASRLNLEIYLVANGSRPITPPREPNAHLMIVAEGADAADDWIAERIGPADVAVTADIPLASRCLEKGARALSFKGRPWTPDNIGGALAGRAVANYARELGLMTGGPAPFAKADRSKFLSALDTAVQAALRVR